MTDYFVQQRMIIESMKLREKEALIKELIAFPTSAWNLRQFAGLFVAENLGSPLKRLVIIPRLRADGKNVSYQLRITYSPGWGKRWSDKEIDLGQSRTLDNYFDCLEGKRRVDAMYSEVQGLKDVSKALSDWNRKRGIG